MSPKQPKWNPSRLFQTLAFFESIPVISQINRMFFGSTPPPPPQPSQNILFNFSQSQSNVKEIWGSLDDVVMGGVSQSLVEIDDSGLVFTGNVSTQNSGGFASIRTKNFSPGLNLSGFQGISLRVKGDGQRYKFFLRDSDGWDTVAYAISFDTLSDGWSTINLPFDQMRPVLRAKTLPSAVPLKLNQISSLQFMLSKFEYDGTLNPSFQAGKFNLVVSTIGLY